MTFVPTENIHNALARRISTNAGSAVKTAQRPALRFNRQRRSLHAFIYSTQGIANDVSARLPNITSASCDLELLPPDPLRGRPFMPLPQGKISANFH